MRNRARTLTTQKADSERTFVKCSRTPRGSAFSSTRTCDVIEELLAACCRLISGVEHATGLKHASRFSSTTPNTYMHMYSSSHPNSKANTCLTSRRLRASRKVRIAPFLSVFCHDPRSEQSDFCSMGTEGWLPWASSLDSFSPPIAS